MRIGELAQATATTTRLLRYYEQQGLLKPQRLDNGYRDYEPYLTTRVHQIRGLIDSGIPTRIIEQMLPCLGEPQKIVVDDAEPELLELLATECDRMSERIESLTRNRNAIASYLQAVREATAQRSTVDAT